MIKVEKLCKICKFGIIEKIIFMIKKQEALEKGNHIQPDFGLPNLLCLEFKYISKLKFRFILSKSPISADTVFFGVLPSSTKPTHYIKVESVRLV